MPTNMTSRSCLLFVSCVALAACGPNARNDDDGDDDTTPDATTCTPSAATEDNCNNGFDEDCNGFVDCADVACVGNEACPGTGGDCEISTPSAALSLPDGACTGIAPDPGASQAEMDAFMATCGSYEATLNLTGFPVGGTLTDSSRFLGVCVNMEHSWLRDLQIEAYCPDGNRVVLSRFQGQDCPNPNSSCEVFLGVPYENDEFGTPVPGTGWDYCWKTTAANAAMIDFSNQDGSPHDLPAGDYQPSEPFSQFTGCALNGGWRIRVVDAWGIDNGYIFSSKLLFDGSLSAECPIIE